MSKVLGVKDPFTRRPPSSQQVRNNPNREKTERDLYHLKKAEERREKRRIKKKRKKLALPIGKQNNANEMVDQIINGLKIVQLPHDCQGIKLTEIETLTWHEFRDRVQWFANRDLQPGLFEAIAYTFPKLDDNQIMMLTYKVEELKRKAEEDNQFFDGNFHPHFRRITRSLEC